ncbi:hypothetical protein SAMN05192574_101924 [Mucilaginibacter gossypiicola]|uniref:DUF6377 domain-containing protein n=1 Tax=Mucilaginibacter gossypiicola TaxID=551995 RepID=A0A1H8BHQ1_9SPHI|nr:hypothetical protein SAMN05192574_101924 [Mucilaginibacter gossypiicola]
MQIFRVIKDINIKREREEMFYRFDSIFFKLFPNFATSFNALLKPSVLY